MKRILLPLMIVMTLSWCEIRNKSIPCNLYLMKIEATTVANKIWSFEKYKRKYDSKWKLSNRYESMLNEYQF